jgi:carboxyl-terminal processing protease
LVNILPFLSPQTAWRGVKVVVYNARRLDRPGCAAEPQGVKFYMFPNLTARRLSAAVIGLALAAVVALAEVPIKPVPLAEPDQNDVKIAKGVVRLLEGAHLTRHKVDDAMSKRVHQLFLESWDPTKRFYLQADIDEFSKFEKDHAEAIKEGKFEYAYTMFKRYRERLEERVKWVNELSAAAQDFTKAETIDLDPKTVSYAKTEEQAKERWRVQVKYELEVMKVNGVKEDEARERVRKRYRSLQRYMAQVDKEELIERYLDALTNGYDPHTSYMSPKSVEQFNIDIRSSLEGVGALLGQDDGVTSFKEIVPGGVIAKDGRIKVGDKIIAVAEGESGGEMVDIEGLRISQVVHLVRGKAGTKVRLEIEPANSKTRVTYTLTRARIELEDRKAKGEVIETESGGKKYKVGVLTLPSFYGGPTPGDDAHGSTADCKRILADFRKEKVDGVVVDLRNNGGGLLTAAVQISGLFIDQGPVVQVKNFQGGIGVHRDTSPGMAWDGPLVVVINKLSASASEILAGVIQDYKRGVIVGDSSTHGKGSVQQILEMSDQLPQLFAEGSNAGALKLTLQMFYRVNGDSTQRRGVRSDIVLPAITDRDLFAESKMDYALEFDQIRAADYTPSNIVDDALLKKLKDASEARRKYNDDFAKYAKKTAKRLEMADRKSLTFTEEVLRQQKKDVGADDDLDDDDKPKTEEKKKKEEKFGTEAYTKEVLGIVGDLIRESGK